MFGLMAGTSAYAADTVGLITKTETNPFFVKMREGAEAKAKELGVTLIACAGKFDGDNDGQVACDREPDLGRRQGLRHRAERLQGHRADHQEGARRRPDGDRARHAARSDGRRRRDLRHRQPQGRPADRPVGRGHARRQGQGRQDRVPRPRHQPADRRLSARPGLHAGLRHRREGSQQIRRRGRRAHLHARNQPGRPGKGPHGDGERAAEVPGRQRGLHDQRAGRGGRLGSAEGSRQG